MTQEREGLEKRITQLQMDADEQHSHTLQTTQGRRHTHYLLQKRFNHTHTHTHTQTNPNKIACTHKRQRVFLLAASRGPKVPYHDSPELPAFLARVVQYIVTTLSDWSRSSRGE